MQQVRHPAPGAPWKETTGRRKMHCVDGFEAEHVHEFRVVNIFRDGRVCELSDEIQRNNPQTTYQPKIEVENLCPGCALCCSWNCVQFYLP